MLSSHTTTCLLCVSNNSWENIESGGPFTDSTGWGKSKYYLTILSPDFYGAGGTVLLSHTVTGLEVWQFDADNNN